MPGGTAHLAVVDQAKNNLKKLETYIITGMENCVEIGLDLVEHDKETCENRLPELRKVMLEYAKMEKDLQHFLEATESVKQQAKNSTEPLNLEGLLDEKLKELRQSTSGVDLVEHEKYLDMNRRIEDMKKTQDDAEETQEKVPTQIDDDLAMTQQEVNVKCPYTGKEMIYPVKNKHCAHSYEKEGIEKYIKQRKGKAKCPVPGCINDSVITTDDLVENHELKTFIINKNRKAKQKK